MHQNTQLSFSAPGSGPCPRTPRHTSRHLSHLLPCLAVVLGVFLTSCRSPIPEAPSLESVFQASKLLEMDNAIERAIALGKCPGGVLWLERSEVAYHRAYGHRALVPSKEVMTEDTLFDAASLTKVVASTPSILLLVERGRVNLDAPARTYLDEFNGDGREEVTVKHLLTHTSGLRPGISLRAEWDHYEGGVAQACAEKPQRTPGTSFRYSDVNFILLGEIVRRVDGRRLDAFSREELYVPLGMLHTGFLPNTNRLNRIAPTTETSNGAIRGVVHDGTARRMDGVAGHAGLFTTAADLARFARMMLNEGTLDGVRIFQPATVRLMTQVQTTAAVAERRGLGWDIDSPYAGPRGAHFPIGSYGHTGWTGGSLWIDPFSRSFVIFLSNRNHPTESGNVIALRRQLGTLAAEAIVGFNFLSVPGALPPLPDRETKAEPSVKTVRVLNGIDVLRRQDFLPLRGLRVGLITNHTGKDQKRQSSIDLLNQAKEVQLVALFSPEHGIRGVMDSRIDDDLDQATGLPIYSLYGATRKPTAGQLDGLDALVFDIQDIGCRFYTYTSTMGLAMEAAAENDLQFFVLDRVNPINGIAVEGPVFDGESRFTAFHALPLRHGMTVGELARLFNAERKVNAKLTVVPLENWTRELWFDQTSQPWTNPSPNMRSLKQAILYPGVGLLETAMSVGRGTDTPFEVIGAPYVDDTQWAEALNQADLPGVRFVPIRFTPQASVFQGKECGGVYMLLTDRDQLNAVDLGILLATSLQRLYPGQFALDKVQTLLQDDATLKAIENGETPSQIKARWADDLAEFTKRREPFLIY